MVSTRINLGELRFAEEMQLPELGCASNAPDGWICISAQKARIAIRLGCAVHCYRFTNPLKKPNEIGRSARTYWISDGDVPAVETLDLVRKDGRRRRPIRG